MRREGGVITVIAKRDSAAAIFWGVKGVLMK